MSTLPISKAMFASIMIGTVILLTLVNADAKGPVFIVTNSAEYYNDNYANEYPYGRCKAENIQATDCKKIGFVLGSEKVFSAEAASLTGLTIEKEVTYFEGYQATGWKLPTLEHIQYAQNQGIINNQDSYLYKIDADTVGIASLAAIPYRFDPAHKVKLLMVTNDAGTAELSSNFNTLFPKS